MKSKVYFTREISPAAVLKLYKMLGAELGERVAVKVHSGEVGNQNFLRPEFWADIMGYVGGTVVECNTAYVSHNISPKFGAQEILVSNLA